jgi:hypothetical protein
MTTLRKINMNTIYSFIRFRKLSISACLLILSFACSSKKEAKEEQIAISNPTKVLPDSLLADAVNEKLSLHQISTWPHTVVLTGLAPHRLVTVYKAGTVRYSDNSHKRYDNYGKSEYDYGTREYQEHYMPGIDLLYGYNLLNVAHYDLTTEKLNFLFDHPVLVKSLYYPSFVQDSLYKKPINRNYFLVSVYDEDTNGDTLINKMDLRKFYHFDATCSEKIQLTPNTYSVVRSEYDPMNDVMYIFARHDADKNGRIDKKEPTHIFWISLKEPNVAKRLY